MSDARALLGTWKMVAWTRRVVATGETSDAMGSDPIGYIAYHADGRMMALVLRRDRPAPAGMVPTDAEKAALFDTMLAYSATYTVEESRVIHKVDAAWNPAWLGDLIRPFTLGGDTLVISGAPSKDPATGEDVVYRIQFNRVTGATSTHYVAAAKRRETTSRGPFHARTGPCGLMGTSQPCPPELTGRWSVRAGLRPRASSRKEHRYHRGAVAKVARQDATDPLRHDLKGG